MTSLTADSFIPYKVVMTQPRLIDQLKRMVRNWLIEKRIQQLQKFDATPVNWSSLSEKEKEHHVKVISAIRHAIQKMKRMKS